MPKSNQDLYAMVSEDGLIPRQDWEKKIAKFEDQRYTNDRPERNDDPFPDASNIRYPLSDMIIEQKKAAYSGLLTSSEYLANYRAMSNRNKPFATNLAPYFDQIVKERTTWESEYVFALDAGLQDGESWVKISYDMESEAPIFKWKENIMMILPGTARMAEDTPWIAEVIHLSKAEAKRRFGKLPGFEDLWKFAGNDDGLQEENDLVAKMRDRYLRAGINNSGRTNMLVLWEVHYEDEDSGEKRIRTISPDDPDFDFQDDRQYPFWCEKQGKKKVKWMYEQFRRELTTPNQHSSRGVPEIVEEFEFLLTAAWRFKHNVMSMTQSPCFQSTTGLPPGSTQNITLELGSILPAGITPVQWPAPPISFDEEMGKTRDIAERRMATPDTGLGRGNIGTDSKTAREVSLIGSLQQMAVSYEITPWKRFCRACYRQAWERIVQFKPQTLSYYINGSIADLPPDAINGDYEIDLSWSGDNINKEYLAQKAFSLWQATLNNPLFNQTETAKNMLEHMTPGQVQRFLANPGIQQQDMAERIGNEIDTMVSVNFPVRAKEDVDHYQAVVLAMQFLQAAQMKGKQLDPQSLQLLSQYMAAHRQMLQKVNPDQYKQLNMQLNQLDQAAQQQQVQVQQVGNPQAAENVQAAQQAGQNNQLQMQGVNPATLQ